MDLSEVPTEDLEEELVKRWSTLVTRPCRCGERREEIRTQETEHFYSRVGCLTCDTWDGPPVLKK